MGSAANMNGKNLKPTPEALHAAIRALDDLGRAGLAVMPLEPSAAMVAAGVRGSGVSEAQVIAVYFAMIAAHAEE